MSPDVDLCAKNQAVPWRFWTILLVLLAIPAAAEQAASRAGTAQVDLEVRVASSPGTGRPAAEVVAMPAGGEQAPRTIALGAAGQGSLMLEAGSWHVYAQADGFWGPSLPFVSAGTGRFALTLKLIPTVPVTGTLLFDRVPEDIHLTARFRQRLAAPPAPSREDVGGVVRCTLEAEAVRFTCPVPAGVLDFRIRVDGHVSHFFRGHEVVAAQASDLGVLRMVPGASLVGQVVTEDGVAVSEAEVLLTPDLSDPTIVGALRQRTDAAGFFHFRGVQAGIFALRVAKEGLLPLEIPGLSIHAGNEAEIAAPLTLASPVAYRVSLTPPVDPQGEPWQVQLLERGRLYRQVAAVAPGHWQIENVPAGRYELLVLDTERNRVASEPIELARGREAISLDLPLMSVVGTVTLGARPLAGRVVFGSIQGAQSVTLEVDAEGLFHGVVPEQERWDIDVMAESPAVVRRFRQVEGSEEADGIVRFDLELPDTTLSGRVVDAEGDPLAGSLVIVLQSPYSELPSFQHTDAGGRFALHGLGFATYAITAEKVLEGTKRESAPIEAELAALSPSSETEIVLTGPEDIVRGKVVFDQGPVPGAVVTLRAPIIPGTSVSKATTNAAGGFELRVPPGTESIRLAIQVTGSVLARLRVARVPGESIQIDLARYQTGTLILLVDDSAAPRGSSPEAWASQPWLIDAASEVYSWGDLSSWATMNGEVLNQGRLIVPFMPAGAYRLCRGKKPDCMAGTLVSGSSLELGHTPIRSKNE